MENESRRMIVEEQRAKIESMESSHRHTVQELFLLTNSLKADQEHTRAALEEEEVVRRAHESTEAQLYELATYLLSTLSGTVGDVNELHDTVERRTDLHTLNREMWQSSSARVVSATDLICSKVEAFRQDHLKRLDGISARINDFIGDELKNVHTTQLQLEEFSAAFDKAEADAKMQTCGAHTEMNNLLEEIKLLRETVKDKVREGLHCLSATASRISKEVISEFAAFQTQVRIYTW